MTKINIKKIVENLIDTFLNAGKVSLLLRQKVLNKKMKSDNTPVSNGDLEVNKILIWIAICNPATISLVCVCSLSHGRLPARPPRVSPTVRVHRHGSKWLGMQQREKAATTANSEEAPNARSFSPLLHASPHPPALARSRPLVLSNQDRDPGAP